MKQATFIRRDRKVKRPDGKVDTYFWVPVSREMQRELGWQDSNDCPYKIVANPKSGKLEVVRLVTVDEENA